MNSVELLKNWNLLDWGVIAVGLQRGWLNKNTPIRYAENLLCAGSCNNVVSLIAGGDFLSEQEIVDLVNKVEDKKTNLNSEGENLNKWRLAFLQELLDEGGGAAKQIEALQEIYSRFDYPEDMRSCSIYTNDGKDPLESAREVLRSLKNIYFKEK